MEVKNNKKWRKLDNTAHVFPVIASRNITNVYRIACILNDDVDKKILKQAVKMVSTRIDVYNVKLKKGFFWYYLEKTDVEPKVKEEVDYPCKYIDPNSTDELLYRVTYYKKRINLEISHVLTDGTGAMNFLKEIIKTYLDLKHNNKSIIREYLAGDQTKFIIEDSYIKNYTKIKNRKGYKSTIAHKLRGSYLPFGMMRVVHATINIDSLKKVTKEADATISEYLVSNLLWTIYKENRFNKIAINPIKVCVPVNLRTYFESETTLNFFSFIPVCIDQKRKDYTFENILEKVKEQFKEELSKSKMIENISYNVSKEKVWILRAVPLFIKKYGIKAIYVRSLKSYTVTLSNLGIVKMEDEYSDEINKFQFIFEPTITDPLKVGVVSYKDKLVLSMTSILENPVLEREYFRFLSSKGVDVEIESNGAKNEKM